LTSAPSLLLGAPLFPLAFPAAFAYLSTSLAGGGDLVAAFLPEAFAGLSSLRLFDRVGALAGIFLDLSSYLNSENLIYDIYLCGFPFKSFKSFAEFIEEH